MDEQRLQAYLSLIQELMSCPSGEEPQVLERHPDLLDAGLVRTCELVAEQFQEAGNEREAEWVRDLGRELGTFLNRSGSEDAQELASEADAAIDERRLQAYLSLIQELMSCPSGEEPQVLERHPDLLDAGLVQTCELVAQEWHQEGREREAEWVRGLAQQLGVLLNRLGSESPQESASEADATTDEGRFDAYFALIQELIDCPSGEEPQVLNRSMALVDAGLVQVCELVAAQLQGV